MLNPKIAKELPPFPTEKLFFKISFLLKFLNPPTLSRHKSSKRPAKHLSDLISKTLKTERQLVTFSRIDESPPAS